MQAIWSGVWNFETWQNLGGGEFALASPTPNSWGTRPFVPVIYAHGADVGGVRKKCRSRVAFMLLLRCTAGVLHHCLRWLRRSRRVEIPAYAWCTRQQCMGGRIKEAKPVSVRLPVPWRSSTRSSAIVEGPRDALCLLQLKPLTTAAQLYYDKSRLWKALPLVNDLNGHSRYRKWRCRISHISLFVCGN